MTTALDPAASPQCVFGADGEMRCAAQVGPHGMWGPRTAGSEARRMETRATLVDAEKQQAVQQRQWLWQQQRSVVAAQQQRPQ